MDVGNIHMYLERLETLDAIEHQGLRDLTLKERWQKLNALFGLGKILGWKEEDDELENVRARWVKLKEHYEKTQIDAK